MRAISATLLLEIIFDTANRFSLLSLCGKFTLGPLFGLLLGIFSAIALMLAMAGIYGVMAYFVTQRTREIGVRIALGAQWRDVLKLIFRSGMLLVTVGLTIGLAGALVLTRLMTTLLFEVSPTDPITFAAVALGVILAALLACYIPTRRATKVGPLVALRYE